MGIFIFVWISKTPNGEDGRRAIKSTSVVPKCGSVAQLFKICSTQHLGV